MSVNITCSRVDLAQVLDLSEQRITMLTRMKVLSRSSDGYDLAASVRGYVRFLRSKSGSLTDERSRLTKAHADLAELKLKLRTGELTESSAVSREFFNTGRQIREGLDNLPPRVAALVAAESSQEKCFQIIKKEIDEVLEAICDKEISDPSPDLSRPRPAARHHSRDVASRRGSA